MSNNIAKLDSGATQHKETIVDLLSQSIATAIPYTGMNFAPFLIHNAQVFGAKAIHCKSHGSVKGNVTTFLLCKQSLSFYYESLSFTSNNVQDYLTASECQPIVQWMHVNEVLKQNSKSTDYKIIRINQVCPCFVNYLSYYPKHVKSILYSDKKEDGRSPWSDLTMSAALSKAFTDQMKVMIKDRTYFQFIYQYKNIFWKVIAMKSYFLKRCTN